MTSPNSSFKSILTFFTPHKTHCIDIDEDEEDIEDNEDYSVSNYASATVYGSVKNSLYGTSKTKHSSLQKAAGMQSQVVTLDESPNSSQQPDALPKSQQENPPDQEIHKILFWGDKIPFLI
jgi:hypothetical protein